MDSAISREERLLFERLKSIREIVGQIRPESKPKMDRLYIRELIYNYISQKKLNPKAAEFDALADDIEEYINRSFNEFAYHLDKKQP